MRIQSWLWELHGCGHLKNVPLSSLDEGLDLGFIIASCTRHLLLRAGLKDNHLGSPRGWETAKWTRFQKSRWVSDADFDHLHDVAVLQMTATNSYKADGKHLH